MLKNKVVPIIFALLITGLLSLITIQFMVNMKKLSTTETESTSIPKVALLLEGPTYDQGWNSSALDSLEQLKEEYGFDLSISDNIDPKEIATVAASYAKQGYDLILGHGVIFSGPFTSIAPSYPDTRFVSINGRAVYPNQTAIRHNMKPAGYLMGKLASLMSKKNKIGYILVDKEPEYAQVQGYQKGAASTGKNTTVIVKKVKDFNDVDNAKKATQEMINQGVDVVYTTGDSFNLPVITMAKNAKIYAMGYIDDQRYIAPDYVIACMLQDNKQMYRTVYDQFSKGRLAAGEVVYGLKEKVNQLSPFGPMVPETVKQQMQQTLQQLVDSHQDSYVSWGK